MNTRKTLLLLIMLLCVGLFLFGCANSEPPATSDDTENTEDTAEPADNTEQVEKQLMNIGTGFPGGNWYPAAAVYAASLEAAVEGLTASVQSTPSTFNIQAINEGKDMQLAFVTSSTVYMGRNGLEPYTEKLTNVCLIGTQEKMLWQMVAPKDSPINGPEDFLNGVSINLGKAGSAEGYLYDAIFNAYGYTRDDIVANGGELQALGWDDAAVLMQDGHLDVAGTVGAIMPSVLNMVTQPGIKFLSLDEDKIPDIIADPNCTGYVKAIMPAGVYDTQDEDVLTLGVQTVLICNADLSDDFVYTATKALYESGYQNNIFGPSEEAGWPKVCNPEDMSDPDLIKVGPVHPGARKYYEEIGIDVPADPT